MNNDRGTLDTEQTVTDIHPLARCWECGYRLWGLPQPICPECGRAFDPSDRWSTRLPGDWKGRRSFLAVCAFVRTDHRQRIWLAAVAAGLLLHWQFKFHPVAWLLSAIGLVLTIGMLARLACSRRPDHPWKRGRRAVLLILLTGLVGNLGYEQCPHGQYVSFGYLIGFNLSGEGCRNPRHLVTPVEWIVDHRNPWDGFNGRK